MQIPCPYRYPADDEIAPRNALRYARLADTPAARTPASVPARPSTS